MIDQPSLQGFCPIADAVDTLASQLDADGRGAVNTRPEVVEFMLDLAGYTACQPLHRMRLLEPSFGGGAFVLAAVGRLLRAFKAAVAGLIWPIASARWSCTAAPSTPRGKKSTRCWRTG